ncbi:flagellar filament capping protein FliD [Gilvimarinus sp. SDUM040013]|uniref:Flagellar hook-associated protein 2 n=1 Tax=Gilvimarinus gilvus TaxID=3058038 RepID=A0ABU4RU79_9GAMM|nr:flagellar filament capping protein FliD [Gilvimarinus sp. SDUM040013]MDO3385070.1 flagellar filament capping protein FliD [Gilvimarinus sp. SDUM040013]MDX6848445.1 flagellar filament capping protein FliD [Gilvimarinus sp. SDUM040013]
MIGSDIVNSLGGGSGINSGSLVEELVSLQNAPEAQRLDTRQEKLESQISDYGLLRSALSNLDAAVSAVSSSDTFDAKSVAIPDTSLIALTKLDSSAAAGNYRIKIEEVAQAQSLSSGSYASKDAVIGKGEITLQFGGWNAALDTFTVDPEKTGATITIDDTNNTLSGLRDAINEADIGVQATVIADGSGYKLLVTSPSGATNELQIAVAEDAGSPGLADFSFDETTQNLTQEQEGVDAQIRVNGLLVSRDSNRITDVVEGLEFDIFNKSATEEINIGISADRSIAETAIRDFVEAYNTFLEETKKLTDFDEETGEYGNLKNDALADNLIDQVRNYLGNSVSGLSDGFTQLSNLGIRTERDGSLDIVENPNEPNTNFRAAIDKNFDLVRDLFVPTTESDNSKVKINGYSGRTQAGSYEVVISQDPTQGVFTGDPLGFPVDTTGKDYSFTVAIDGVETASISLPDGVTYNTGEELAAEFQALINLDESLQAANVTVNVAINGSGALEFTSEAYGSDSKVVFGPVGGDFGDLGIAAGSGVTGKDVVGTVNGEQAFGYGNILLPAINTKADGLSMTITPGASNATVNFSRGFAGGLVSLIDTFTRSNGLIKEHVTELNDSLDEIDDDRSELERRTEAYRARLQSQFIAMEQIVSSLNNTGSFLDGILDRLPFTAKK